MNNIRVEVTGVSGFPPHHGGYMVILKEQEGRRWLPIFIGAAEAHNISLLLQEVKYVRPLTYDLFATILKEAGTAVNTIHVTDLRDNTFFAEVILDITGVKKAIDARPSDAIALAIKTKAPIFVNSKVMDEAGLLGDGAMTVNLDFSERLKTLNKQLEDAVEIEAYEEAAKIRDQIKALEEAEVQSKTS